MDPSTVPAPEHAALAARLREAGCVFAEDEAALLAAQPTTPAQLEAMVARRTTGEPLEQVLGWCEFAGLRIALEPGVFVPRRRTELLVYEAVSLARASARGTTVPVVVDLCCGSGAVGAAVAAALGRVELHSVDVDAAAVSCARGNVAPAGGQVYQGDLYDPLSPSLQGRVDLLLANPPYVPDGELPLLPAEARLHEPRSALAGGADGLDVLRRIAADAPRWLAPGGHLVAETSERQAPGALEALRRTGLRAGTRTSVDTGATVVVATRVTHRA